MPDPLIVEAYRKAAEQNVLAAVNPNVFPGYFSVCADGRGFGYGNTYPSLDGHQMTDALLWLGGEAVAKANWDYVRTFQREDGSLPLAILLSKAGQDIGPKGYPGIVAANGGLYKHWVPGNPLAALASPTYIQNADVIFRRTRDLEWLRAQIGSVNRAADYLESLTTSEGVVKGGGYYVERPSRLDSDGVTQPHAIDAFTRAAALNATIGDKRTSARFNALSQKIRRAFSTRFWVKDHFAEYLHPERGLVDRHGLSDTNWAALAMGAITPQQRSALWPRMRSEAGFHYGGMPSGIVTDPGSYEAWEFSYPDRMDVAAMGRVWYLEAQARARMNDADGLLQGIRKVCETGRAAGYYWRERYTAKGGHGAEKYCEYPANLIRIVQRFLFGVEFGLDGSLELTPTAPAEFWERGFGQTMMWQGRTLAYRMQRGTISGTYAGPDALVVGGSKLKKLNLPKASPASPHHFEVRL